MRCKFGSFGNHKEIIDEFGINLLEVLRKGDKITLNSVGYYVNEQKEKVRFSFPETKLNIGNWMEDEEKIGFVNIDGNRLGGFNKELPEEKNVEEGEVNKAYSEHKERIIVTLTSWKKRIVNVPTVIKSILNQSIKPDKIILNLSSEEFAGKERDLPKNVLIFFEENKDVCELFWLYKNSKVWKKTLPTLRRYPEEIIINIDDDFIYPVDMIENLFSGHLANPYNPISGNNVSLFGINCQCGCASLVKFEFFKDIFDFVDYDLFNYFSDDIFFSYVAAKNEKQFKFCGTEYFMNMELFNEIEPQRAETEKEKPIVRMWNYLIRKFGVIGDDRKILHQVY